MLVFGDQDWITTLHYSFQDKENLVRDSPGRVGGGGVREGRERKRWEERGGGVELGGGG